MTSWLDFCALAMILQEFDMLHFHIVDSVYRATAFFPSWTASLANSGGNTRHKAAAMSLLRSVERRLYLDICDASVAMRSKQSSTKLPSTFIAGFVIFICENSSQWTFLILLMYLEWLSLRFRFPIFSKFAELLWTLAVREGFALVFDAMWSELFDWIIWNECQFDGHAPIYGVAVSAKHSRLREPKPRPYHTVCAVDEIYKSRCSDELNIILVVATTRCVSRCVRMKSSTQTTFMNACPYPI